MMPTDPAPPEPALQVAARLLAQGRPAAAAGQLSVLVAGAPTYAAAHALRATALEAAGFVDEAIVSWGRAAALVPRSPLVHRERERLLATRLADDLPSDLPPAEPEPPPAQDAAGPDASDDLSLGDVLAPLFEPADPPADAAPAPDAGRDLPDEADLPAPALTEPDRAHPRDGRPSVADDLDALISQLADAPRIRPDPSFKGPAVVLDAGDTDDMASETLAQIFAAQGQFAAAAEVYEKMAARLPGQADGLLERAAELRRR